MKVAVSIPNPVFAEAEKLVRRFRITRSELYARALTDFVGNHPPDDLTDAMNRALENIDQSEDKTVLDYSVRQLDKLEW